MRQEEIVKFALASGMTPDIRNKNNWFVYTNNLEIFEKYITFRERVRCIEAVRTIGGEFSIECEKLINSKEFN